MVEEGLWAAGLLVQRLRDHVGIEFLLLSGDTEVYCHNGCVRVCLYPNSGPFKPEMVVNSAADKIVDVSFADPNLVDVVVSVCLEVVFVDD